MYILFYWWTNLDNSNQNGSQKWCQHLMSEHNCLFHTLDVPYILHPVHTCPQIVHRAQLLNSINQDCMDLNRYIQVQVLQYIFCTQTIIPKSWLQTAIENKLYFLLTGLLSKNSSIVQPKLWSFIFFLQFTYKLIAMATLFSVERILFLL